MTLDPARWPRFSDDLAILSYPQQQMQERNSMVVDNNYSARFGPNVYRKKSKRSSQHKSHSAGRRIAEGSLRLPNLAALLTSRRSDKHAE